MAKRSYDLQESINRKSYREIHVLFSDLSSIAMVCTTHFIQKLLTGTVQQVLMLYIRCMELPFLFANAHSLGIFTLYCSL